MKRKEAPKFNLQHVYELFRNYFSGTATDKEREIVEKWHAPKERKSGLSKRVIEEDRIYVYNKLNKRFGFNSPLQPAHKTFVLRSSHWQIAAAASILIVLGLSIAYWTKSGTDLPFLAREASEKTIFETGLSGIKILKLSDGSIVTLNSGTKLAIVDNQFNHRQREVWLEGEAFFEVAKNPEKPFIIHTGTMQTTVRGTSFNVKAYPQLAENVVTVRTGKVGISLQGKQLALLTPDQQVIYHTLNGRFETGMADAENAAGWRNGRLILNSASADELKLRLKQQYNIDLVIQNKALQGIMLNSSFAKGTSLNEVMNTIADFYKVKYHITSSGLVILSE